MSSVQNLRDFILQRLSAAAEEIFSLFQKTIEEEMERQRRLLDVSWRPEAHLGGTDESFVYLDQEFPTDQNLGPQEQNFCLDQEEPEPPRVKEEEEELLISAEEEWLGVKHEAGALMGALVYEGSSHGGPEPSRDGRLLDASGAETGARSKCSEPPRHQSRAHRADWTQRCDVCGKGFSKASELRAHYRIHTGEKPFSCPTCQKAFTFKSNLRVHLRTHTNEAPFSCQTCAKVFKHRSSLMVHGRSHTGERPYACATCGKRFTDKSSLKQHSVTHTGDRMYSCALCGRGFNRSSYLLQHMKVHTPESFSSIG